MGASKNNGTPKSSILIGFSIIFTIHFGGNTIPIFGTSIYPYSKVNDYPGFIGKQWEFRGKRPHHILKSQVLVQLGPSDRYGVGSVSPAVVSSYTP